MKALVLFIVACCLVYLAASSMPGAEAQPAASEKAQSGSYSANGVLPEEAYAPETSGNVTNAVTDDFSLAKTKFLNMALVSLPGNTNAVVKALYSGFCAARITDMGGASLTYEQPYISFLFCPVRSSPWDIENPSGDVITGESNPFRDDLVVYRVSLWDNLSAVFSGQQNSLGQLFQTEKPITYALLCDKLHQTPAINETQNFAYAPVSLAQPEKIDDAKTDGLAFYESTFEVELRTLRVLFVQHGAEYLAFSVTINNPSVSLSSGN
jgi:hypothetical protein